MSQRSETERQQVLDRLRRQRPDDTWFICGQPGDGPQGYRRVYSTNRTRYVDVPESGIHKTHSIPANGDEAGIAFIVDRDADFRIRRTKLSELLEGPILERLWELASILKCWTYKSKTPIHSPGAWLDVCPPEVDWRPWAIETDRAGASPEG
jgi:hypothetical protein